MQFFLYNCIVYSRDLGYKIVVRTEQKGHPVFVFVKKRRHCSCTLTLSLLPCSLNFLTAKWLYTPNKYR